MFFFFYIYIIILYSIIKVIVNILTENYIYINYKKMLSELIWDAFKIIFYVLFLTIILVIPIIFMLFILSTCNSNVQIYIS